MSISGVFKLNLLNTKIFSREEWRVELSVRNREGLSSGSRVVEIRALSNRCYEWREIFETLCYGLFDAIARLEREERGERKRKKRSIKSTHGLSGLSSRFTRLGLSIVGAGNGERQMQSSGVAYLMRSLG